MHKRYVLICAFAFLFGILIRYYGVFPWLVLLIILLLYSFIKNKSGIGLVAALIISASFGGWHCHICKVAYDNACRLISEGDRLSVSGRVSAKQKKKDTVSLELSSVVINDDSSIGEKILIYVDSDSYPIGSMVSGYASPIIIHKAMNEGGFDEASYLASRNIAGKLAADSLDVIRYPVLGIGEYLYRLSEKMGDYYERSLPGEESWIIKAMCLGDRSGLDDEVREMFSDAGLGHLLAISGLHISLIGRALYGFLRRRKKSFLFSGVVSGVFLILYGMMTGFSVSALRAIGMYFIFILGDILGEAYDMATAAAVLMIVILTDNPMAFLSSGFVLSFSAVYLLACFVLPLEKLYDKVCLMRLKAKYKEDYVREHRNDSYNNVIKSLLFSAGIWLVMLPVTCHFYYKFSLFSPLLNLILVPLAAPLVIYSLLTGFAAVIIPGVPTVIMFPMHLILYLYEWACAGSGRLLGSNVITGNINVIKILLIYLIIIMLFKIVIRDVNKELSVNERRLPWRRIRQGALFGNIKRNAAMGGIVVLTLGLLLVRKGSGFELDMLSVGQGDGIFVSTPHGRSIMFDGGSTSEEDVGEDVIKKFLLYRGISGVDLWLISHTDDDHINGFTQLLKEGFPIGAVVLAKNMPEDEKRQEIIKECDARGIKVIYLLRKESVTLDGVELECIWPGSGIEGPNENSLSLWMSYRDKNGVFDTVFTGDIGEEQEKAILKYIRFKGKIEVLKAAHHGSNYSNCSAWLEAVDPVLCIISAGERNRYGHPGKKAIARMDELGTEHLCTIDCGEISVRWKGGETMVERFVK